MNEFWDLYDENRNLLGKNHERGIPIPEGEYHLVVDIIVITKGKLLVTKRHQKKPFGGL